MGPEKGLGRRRKRRTSAASTAVKRPRRFSFYLVGFYLIGSGNIDKDV